MFRLLVLMFLLPATSLKAASLCDELWLTRNAIYDRAGFCFSSELGKAIFNNDDCVPQIGNFDAKTQALIDQVHEEELRHQCNVNTSRHQLDFRDWERRLQFEDLPVPDGLESSCLNYLGPAFPLFRARNVTSAISGKILTSDNIAYNYNGVAEWMFLTVYDDEDQIRTEGWHPGPEPVCEYYAG